MNLFLRFRHWQLFLLFVVLPLAINLAFDRFGVVQGSALFFRLPLNVLLIALAIGYLWSVGSFFFNRLPEKSPNLSLGWFRIALLLSGIIQLATTLLSGYFIPEVPEALYVMVPLQMIALAGLFYGFYFVAKSVAGVKKEADANLNDFAGYLFMLWFFPIGIWFFQPEVNRLAGVKDPASRRHRGIEEF